jgi:hypothetical protein
MKKFSLSLDEKNDLANSYALGLGMAIVYSIVIYQWVSNFLYNPKTCTGNVVMYFFGCPCDSNMLISTLLYAAIVVVMIYVLFHFSGLHHLFRKQNFVSLLAGFLTLFVPIAVIMFNINSDVIMLTMVLLTLLTILTFNRIINKIETKSEE